MPRSPSTWSTSASAGTRRWTGNCTSHAHGRPIPTAVRMPDSTRTPAFATKPEPARVMIERFPDAGHRVGWFTGDEVHGGNPKLRTALENRGIGYVLAVACSAEVPTGAGTFRADALVKKVPRRAWQKLSARPGAKEQRRYDWAVIDLTEAAPRHHQLLIRRNRTSDELAYYRCHSTTPATRTTLVTGRPDPADVHRDPAPVHHCRCPARSRPGPPAQPSAWRRRHQARSRPGHCRRQV